MHWFFLFSFLYVFKKYLNSQLSGIDERVEICSNKLFYDNISFERVLQIQEINEKIQFLESNNIPIYDKLYEIRNRDVPEIYNMSNGGLFDDWDFDFPN